MFLRTCHGRSQPGALLIHQGEVRQAFNLYRQLIEQTASKYWWGVGILYSHAAKAALDLGQVEWAEHCLSQGLSICRQHEDPVSRTELEAGLGRLFADKAKWDQARHHLENALEGYTRLQWSSAEITGLLELGHLYRYQRDNNKAAMYLSRVQDKMGRMRKSLGALLWAERGLLETWLGQYENASSTIRISKRIVHQFGDKKAQLYILLASVIGHSYRGNKNQALLQFGQAVHLAKLSGFDGILVREVHNHQRLSELGQRCGVEKAYLSALNLKKGETRLRIQVRCFGGLEVADEFGRSLAITWPTEKAMSLFAYLITQRGSPIRGEILSERLWPGLSRSRANEHFRSTASRMRESLARALPGVLTRESVFAYQHGRYRFMPDIQVKVDVEEFEDMMNSAETITRADRKEKGIRRALELYKGDYLPEVYDQWTDFHREKLRNMRLKGLHWLAEHAAATNDEPGSIAACKAYLEADPISEEIARLYMKVLCGSGRVSAAKACYKALKESLWHKLGSAPAQETRDLYQVLLNSASVR